MKSLKTFLESQNDDQLKIKFQNELISILKDADYKECQSKDKIESLNDQDLYYYLNFDEIYISYYNHEQYGKIIIFNDMSVQLLNIDIKGNNEIEILSCDLKDSNDRNKFLTDFTNYIGISQKEGTTNKNSVQMAHSSSI